MATAAGVMGIFLSLALGGAFGTPAATGAAPAATPRTATTTTTTTPGTAGLDASVIFGCRASLTRAVLAGQTLAEPAVANHGEKPCVDDTKAVQSIGLLGPTSPVNIGSVGPAGETTYEVGALGGAVSPAATSISNVNAVTITIPNSGYTITAAGPLESQAAVECVGTSLKTQGTSNLDAITITGPGIPGGSETIELGGYVNQVVGGLPPQLAAVVSITANERTVDATSLTESLLDVKLLSGTPAAAQVVVGESRVSYPNPAICTQNVPGGGNNTTVVIVQPGSTNTVVANGTTTTVTSPGSTTTVGSGGTTTTVTVPGQSTTVTLPSGSVPTVLQQCTSGSVYDPVTGNCVIYENGQAIFVSKPFQGPTGGTVISLTAARGKYRSPCLYGSGPRWVLIVSKYGIHATGTPGPDRILGLSGRQSIYGLDGNDCIDAKGARALVNDHNGNDRDYVTSGYNRIIVGNGRDYVYGRQASGWITAGTGSDHIYGGSRGMRIDAYGNHKTIYGGAGRNRIWSNSAVAHIFCGSNKGTVLFARRGPAAYAVAHGSCRRVIRLR